MGQSEALGSRVDKNIVCRGSLLHHPSQNHDYRRQWSPHQKGINTGDKGRVEVSVGFYIISVQGHHFIILKVMTNEVQWVVTIFQCHFMACLLY